VAVELGPTVEFCGVADAVAGVAACFEHADNAMIVRTTSTYFTNVTPRESGTLFGVREPRSEPG
jgi:hypothetical protein